MGAESSILEDCQWEDGTTDGVWTLTHGKLSDDSEISQFSLKKQDKNLQDILRKYIKNLKIIRHPSVLTYVCSQEGANGPELITEKAIPLETVLPNLSSSEICAGLHTILEALQFLHEKVGASHNNLHLGAIYVTVDGSWRLGALQHLCKFSEATPAFLEGNKAYRDECTVTPEEKEGKVCTESTVGHARDVYTFAVMTESLLEGMHDLGDLTKSFEQRIQEECLHKNPKHRPSVSSLLTDRIFNTTFLEISLFLKNITLKSEAERKSFFKNLLQMLHSLPKELVARRLVPGLLSRFVFMDQTAVKYVLPSLLTPQRGGNTQHGAIQPLLSDDLFKQYVVPKLVKILAVHDCHIHILLLQYFPKFVHLIDMEDLEFEVFPQILLGLRDSSEQIAALSLHALAEMVPILGREIVIGGKSKTFFKERQPKGHGNFLNSPLNNQQLNSGKMKLIDLVKHSPTKVNKEDSAEKRKEKELKREEWRRKREEKKALKEKRKDVNESAVPVLMSEKVSEIVDNLQSEDTLPTTEDETDFTTIPDTHVKHSINNDFSKTNSVEDVTGDWSDWSDEAGHSDNSEAIGEELSIEEGLTKEEGLKTTSTSSPSSNQDHSIPRSTGHAMKIGTKKHKETNSVNDKKLNDIELSEEFKNINLSSKRTVHSNNKKELGSEFDIKNLEVKVSSEKSDPFDFFSDMSPKIEIKKTKLLEELTSDKLESSFQSKEVHNKFSLDVQDANAGDSDDGGGWGDDDDW
ncbi:protein-associating with the carboxyl-terminal domain of ezrin-like isoform X2 [Ruditapes philippinarum]|uniref:protein-associating with the carboxyl-terminal domain of ezrin-like isoform X2 n=1 Tax=Ruditapes philippinarum TaxID=129788 RepID=UPI00295AD741|nr:protein-associating with the carboxyl-terminal domain of ezrin-like isoform X2 [Ruditapes philippinarum]